jgi:cephalosporin hydroxylase
MMTEQLTFRHLRLTATACFREYLENTRLWGEVGNEAFAEHVRSVGAGNTPAPVAGTGDKPYRLYHSWLPQMLELTAEQAGMIRELIRGVPETGRTQQQQEWTQALAGLGWLTEAPADIDCLVARALEQIIAIQNPCELREYLQLVQALRPRVVVEIGSARGGMLYCFCQLAAPDALIISIDLPGAPNCGGQTAAEREYYSSFVAPGQQIRFIPANSHFHATREALRQLLNGRRADVLFIDGDHSYGGVKIDFDMYAGFAAPGGLLTLHDICLRPEHWGAGNDVGLFWDEIKQDYEVQEIIDPGGMCRPDRPDGVAACWGIGVIGQKRLA